ncbi:hypothetical protein FB45DRAFT_863185 [Roridomyces roridus]|uniref:Uncharacterized protein n=1 Tax=Roridomyces roridus TaxID=1738132 RepID=A0AAD7C8W7_9AGAR|nr:hypothetical protein FB45DRAFT_863185 [Roridomyces roridus]
MLVRLLLFCCFSPSHSRISHLHPSTGLPAFPSTGAQPPTTPNSSASTGAAIILPGLWASAERAQTDCAAARGLLRVQAPPRGRVGRKSERHTRDSLDRVLAGVAAVTCGSRGGNQKVVRRGVERARGGGRGKGMACTACGIGRDEDTWRWIHVARRRRPGGSAPGCVREPSSSHSVSSAPSSAGLSEPKSLARPRRLQSTTGVVFCAIDLVCELAGTRWAVVARGLGASPSRRHWAGGRFAKRKNAGVDTLRLIGVDTEPLNLARRGGSLRTSRVGS